MVVGYGTKKKINLTGAVAAIDGKALVQTPVANLSNAVAGRMPGVMALNSSGEPASGSTLSIRGNSTLKNNTPLIVVDGIPRDSFNAFDPNEIESITVLKDGAAAAVYGARANNGVFLVTTKRGKKRKIQYYLQWHSLLPKSDHVSGINGCIRICYIYQYSSG